MRAYLRMHPEWVEEKEADGYPDGAITAFGKLLGLGEQQPYRGRFKSLALLKASLGRHGRWVSYLIEHNDVVPLPDGWLYIEGWDEWQEGDWQVSERMKRVRARRGESVSPSPGAVRTANWRLRQAVFERDHFTCRYCGDTEYERQWLIAEHVDPTGPSDLDNLVAACRPCNKKKGGRTPSQAAMALLPVPVGDASRLGGSDASHVTGHKSNASVIAVGGRHKAVGNSNKNPLPPADLNAEPEREGLKNPETMARAEAVVDWWMRQQGWPSLSGVTRHRLVTQATSYAEMPISDDELMAMLQVGWDSMPSDNKPHDLNFFATRAEQLVGTIHKARRPVIVEGKLPAGVGVSDRDPDE